MASRADTDRSRRVRDKIFLAMTWRAYDLGVRLVVWTVLVPVCLVHVLLGRASLRHLRERLGRRQAAMPQSADVLVHAVSAGEAVAAGAFVRALAQIRPSWTVILTCGNNDALAVATRLQQRIPTIAGVTALPWDRWATMRRWLATLDVRAAVVVEPEIWPNLYRACHTLSVPLFLANGHIYPRDVRRYRLARPFFADVLRLPAWIGAQSEDQRHRLIAIGAPPARVEVVDSFKFVSEPQRDQSRLFQHVASARHNGSQIIVAGSTYAAEEALLLDVFEQLAVEVPRLRLILAPRHVRRARAVLSRARTRGHHAVAASAAADPSWTLLVVDRLGELADLYRLADVAFVGGTLIDRGGHNVLEPARVDCPTIVGPYVRNIQHIVNGLSSVNGIARLPDATSNALRNTMHMLLTDSVQRHHMAAQARQYCAERSGGARRTVDTVVEGIGAGHAGRRANAGIMAGAQPGVPQAT